MKKIIVIPIVIILIISALMIYYYIVTAEGEPWIEGGEFKHSLIAIFEDGSTGEITLNKPVFSVSIDEKNIDQIQYILEGKIDGESLSVNISDYSIVFSVFDIDGNFMNNFTLPSNGFIVDTVDGEFVPLMDNIFDAVNLFDESIVDGEYFIRMIPSGVITYNYLGGWRDSNLPSVLEFNVKYMDDDGTPSITLIWRTSIDIQYKY